MPAAQSGAAGCWRLRRANKMPFTLKNHVIIITYLPNIENIFIIIYNYSIGLHVDPETNTLIDITALPSSARCQPAQ